MMISKIIMFCTSCLIIVCSSCMKDSSFEPVSPVPMAFADSSASNPHSSAYQSIINKYIQKGVPGMVLIVDSPENGLWLGAGGKSCIEKSTPMEKSTLLFSASVGKTYCAVAILLLAEEGKLNLDDKIQTYLPKDIYDKIPNGKKATIRQLLTMQSGIPDIDSNITHLFEQVNDIYAFDEYDAIEYVYDKKPDFEPGTETKYSSTNYELLAKIIDRVTGEHHSKYYSRKIFTPLGLQQTYYKNESGYPDIPGLENVYIDRFGDGRIENFTRWEKQKVTYLTGSDGIIASMYDYYSFFRALLRNKILCQQMTEQMKQWNKWNEEPEQSYLKRYAGYAYGLFYVKTSYGNCYGHTGNSGGLGIMIYYFPHRDITIGYAINITTSLAGKWFELFQRDIWADVMNAVLK